MHTVAHLFLRVYPSLRTAQGGILILDVVSEKHGDHLCRDIVLVLIASIAIWTPEILLHFVST